MKTIKEKRMGGIEGNNKDVLRLGKKGNQINLNDFNGKGIKQNETNKSIFEKFDINKDGQLDEKEVEVLKAFLSNRAGNDGVLSKREVKKIKQFGTKKSDVKNFYAALNDMHSQQVAANNKPAQPQAPTPAPAEQQEAVQEAVEEQVTVVAEEVQEQEQPEHTQKPENVNHQYKVNYKDTWYGIVQAKYGITDHKQTMEIVRQLKAQNNVDPKAANMPKEITLPENIKLKNGTEIKMTDIDAAVDQSHWGYKTTSKTGRYTITQNGETKYYAADGTELKQSYFEAREASADKRKVSENGSGRYSYTAENGDTYYFEADGTQIEKEYYERRENEYTAVNAQKEAVKNARTAFEQQQKQDGWAGKTADAVSVLWNSDNRAVKVEEDLKTYENQIKELQTAQSKGAAEYSAKFKEIYGVPYNPENVAAYEANPTDENYKKAYGTKNDIHKRVMDYNKSQQEGAAAVKTTVVAAASAAAAVATGGTSLAATAAITAGSTMAARTAVEVSDLATNDVDGDVNMQNVNDIAEQSMVEGVITGATAGVLKGAGGMFGKAASKAAPKSSGGVPAPVPKSTSSSGGGLVKAGSKNTAGNAGNAGRAGNAGNAGRAGNAGNAGNAANAASQMLKDAKDIAAKVSRRGGLRNLNQAERTRLAELLEITPEKLANLSKADYKKLILKFHPDKNPNNLEFAKEMSAIINSLRSAI